MFKREALELMSLSELAEIESALGFNAGKQKKEDLINSILLRAAISTYISIF